MVYIPTRTVVIENYSLVESTDLTIPLSYFVDKTAFLVLHKNHTDHVVEIGEIVLQQNGLDLSQPISSGFSSLLNDAFVARYSRSDIPLLNIHGTYNKRLKVLNPLSYKDYTTKFTSMGNTSVVDDVTQKGFLDDLVIASRENLHNSLVAVNGVFHKTSLLDNKLYVHDGFRTMRVSDYKDVTLIDTSALGGHSIIPLTSSNVTFTTYNDKATINAGVSLKDKTVLLVIDGYIYHLNNQVFYFADDQHIKVWVSKLPLISQFRHNPRTMKNVDRYGVDTNQSSRKYTNAYDNIFLNQRQVATSVLTTRDFQYSRLTHYHSFLVVINNPSVFTVEMDIIPTGTPQFYYDAINRVLSGMVSYGEGLSPSYLIHRDPFGRKYVYLQKQDYDVNWQAETISPTFIPALISEPQLGANARCRFVDYVSA